MLVIFRVSVVVPVYNGRRFLREAIASVIQQTLAPMELIIIDDGSTDDSISLVDELLAPFPVIKVCQENSGQSAARNRGVRIAKGDYIAFLDQDDRWYPEHLEKLANTFLQNSQLDWAYSNFDELDENGQVVTIGLLNDVPAPQPKRRLSEMLSGDMFILPSASMVKKECLLAIGGFDERLSGYEDDDLFLRMFRAGYRCFYLNRSLLQYRIYSGSGSKSFRMARSRKIYAHKLMTSFPDDPAMCRYWVRDCIAPRFFNALLDEYLRGIKTNDDTLCQECVLEMAEYAALMSLGQRMRIKLRIMRNSRLYRHITRLKSKLPYPLRRLI